MSYDSKIHHRSSIRLKGYDYSREGMYFITICCHKMKCMFGEIQNDEMILNNYGKVANDTWIDLPNRYGNIGLGEHVIMPNHMHGILIVRAVLTAAQNPITIGNIIGAYKSITTNKCLEIFKIKDREKRMGKLWHRNYYEHIIRSQRSYENISRYIMNNPANWQKDRFYGNDPCLID